MMVYTVKQMSGLAGISVRTLHYCDEIGLLVPVSRSAAGYRLYSENDLLRLQQIMFYRELGVQLVDIKQIITRPDFNLVDALQSHRNLLLKMQNGHED
jgi:DNA-binding transcriptional MerR regulator